MSGTNGKLWCDEVLLDLREYERKHPVVKTATGWYRDGAPVPNLDEPPCRTPTFQDGALVTDPFGKVTTVQRSYFDYHGDEIAVLWPHPKDHSGFYFVSQLKPAMPYSIDPIRRSP